MNKIQQLNLQWFKLTEQTTPKNAFYVLRLPTFSGIFNISYQICYISLLVPHERACSSHLSGRLLLNWAYSTANPSSVLQIYSSVRIQILWSGCLYISFSFLTFLLLLLRLLSLWSCEQMFFAADVVKILRHRIMSDWERVTAINSSLPALS